MKFRRSSKKSSGRSDFDINIVPIIDCLTILLTFMLASGAFISLGVLEIGVAGPSAEVADSKPPEIDLSVKMLPSRDLSIVVTGKIRKSIRVEKNQNGEFDWVKLNGELSQFGEHYSDVKSVTLVADLDMDYQDIVKAMEAIKRTHPDVLLGGF